LDRETSDSCPYQITENDSHLLRNHPSVKRIAESISAYISFSFKEVGCKLNQDKTTTGPFSIKVVRIVADIDIDPVSKLVNTAFQTSTFPQSLKHARVTPVFEKDDKFQMKNYRPISILSAFSKI